MAMGVSTQSGPLKPCSSSPFWSSPSCRRSASMTSSPHACSGSSKSFQRKEFHSVQYENVCNCNFTGSFIQFKRGLSNSTGSVITKDGACERKRCCPYPYYCWRLEVRTQMSHSPTSSARMFPYYSNQIDSERKLQAVRLVNMRNSEEEEKQTPRHHGPPLEDVDVSPPCQSSDYKTSNYRATENMISRNSSLDIDSWLEERRRLREIRSEVRRSIELGTFNDGGSCGNFDSHPDPFHGLRFDNINGKKSLQCSFNQENMGFDFDNVQACKPPYKPSDRETCTVKCQCRVTMKSSSASHVTTQHESRSCNNVAINNACNLTVNKLAQVSLYSTQIARDQAQLSESLPLKPFEENEGQLNKLDGLGMGTNDITERIPSNSRYSTNAEESVETYTISINPRGEYVFHQPEYHEMLSHIYKKVLVVDNIAVAKEIVRMLTTRYKDLVHACDTEVAKIDAKQETPVDHGELICFSIYSGPEVDFGNGKSCIWVDVLDGGGRDILMEFAPFFEDPSIRKVWHNYSFDSHVIENYGLKISGFHADTMHMARLWDSSRRKEGGYSLEALTMDPKVMSEVQQCTKGEPIKKKWCTEGELIGKISMKTIFGKKKIKKDGSEGKVVTVPPVEELQREERIPWIFYSTLDSISTLKLFESLKIKLKNMEWVLDGVKRGTMYDFYEEYWRPFGELLVKMETEGMLVDRAYLAEMEKVATEEQQVAAKRFCKWASRYCSDAIYMNVGSDAQLRQLFFGGTVNRKNPDESLPLERTFRVLNVDKVTQKGKKAPPKYRNITLCKLGNEMQTEMYTATGWPSVSMGALKNLSGKVSAEYDFTDYSSQSSESNDILPEQTVNEVEKRKGTSVSEEETDISAYGTAYTAFGGGKEGREACHAIAALCEVCSIDSLVSNFILPLQGSHILGKNGRVHCSLNINTETGRLSARRPNLQNQPALEKDRYKIRQAFIAAPGNSLIVADYGQLELRILAHLANCKSMLDAFKAGGDFHSRTAMNMYPHIRKAVEQKQVLLEWHPQTGEVKPPVPLLKDAFASERRKAKMLNFSIAYGKTPVGLARDWKVSVTEAKETLKLWYKDRQEVLHWQEERKQEAAKGCVYTLLGRSRRFPSMDHASNAQCGHIERAAINTPVQVHDEVILEGPNESAEEARAIVVKCMSKPFYGTNFLKVDLSVDAKCARNWYAAK
ncbi:PREDICTED: DNA polymerase I A, chloroplastic/mitochondrial-like isoform X2 [Nelumbo nucifera]|uniref:DNA-directed DNA polymerase n=1 Tax=Nelumbo nucifera TaxID=4432 RepID=A0A1U8QBT1_NELNU|nr:PREDICTED: DNA polymerase I A, chloroplastic/mitochondrial-like isoform X2 [Nelumbo nucifera]